MLKLIQNKDGVRKTGVGGLQVRPTVETAIQTPLQTMKLPRLKALEAVNSPAIQALLDARTAGQINPGVAITGGGDLVRDEGRPDWKWSASATWRYEQFTLGAFTQYVGDVQDFGIIDAAGNPWIIDSQVTANLYGQYEFTEGMAANTRLRLGVRNLTDEQPPVATTGYLGELYTPYSRYWYVSVRKTF